MPSHIEFAVALLLAVTVVVRSAEDTCRDQATCEDFPGSVAEKASAMLQVMSKVVPQERVNLVQEGLNILQWQSAHLEEARSCMPHSLGEFHLASKRQNAAGGSSPQAKLARQLAASKAKPPPPSLEDLTPAPPTEAPATKAPMTEAPAIVAPAPEAPVTQANPGWSLDRAAEFKATTSLCCPVKMEIFFNSLLDSLGFDACSVPHIQGLMHWFTCVPDMDFQYMLDVIHNGNPCKYWAPKGQTCPPLSEMCAGHQCR